MTNLEVARNNMSVRLGENPYPGRGIALGTTRNGAFLIEVYWIMGRSENSRNRLFRLNGTRVSTEVADPAKVKDPSLIIYNAMVESGNGTYVVSNGAQTDTVLRKMTSGYPFMDTLYDYSYESDAPNFTPRITGAWSLDVEGRGKADLAILRKSTLDGSCDRIHYQYQTMPSGFGYCLTTYSSDGNPLPAFQGDPFVVCFPDNAIEGVASYYWQHLNMENRISLAVKFISMNNRRSRTFFINKYKKA